MYAARVSAALAATFPPEFPTAKRPAVVITQVQFWDGSVWDSTCRDSNPDAIPAFDRMQKLTLTATVPASEKSFSIEIIKRAG